MKIWINSIFLKTRLAISSVTPFICSLLGKIDSFRFEYLIKVLPFSYRICFALLQSRDKMTPLKKLRCQPLVLLNITSPTSYMLTFLTEALFWSIGKERSVETSNICLPQGKSASVSYVVSNLNKPDQKRKASKDKVQTNLWPHYSSANLIMFSSFLFVCLFFNLMELIYYGATERKSKL